MANEIERRVVNGEEKYHAVLVPRASANLAAVIRTICKGFEGDRIRDIEQRLTQSQVRMTEQGAKVRVVNELAFVLDPKNVDGIVLKPKPTAEEREIAELLPFLLAEPSVKRKLIEDENGTVARLAQHIGGVRRGSTNTDADFLRWAGDELAFHAGDVLKISPEHAPEAYELAVQLQTDSQTRTVAAELLTLAWVPALGQLLGLRRGDLDEALREIRRTLLAEKKDLVLLIEDLSVAHGIDSDLVEALLVGAEGSGETLCKMRSVVGVTNEDYDRLQENVANRARETVFFNVSLEDDGQHEGVSQSALVTFAARYLNAARYDVKALDEWGTHADSSPLSSYCQSSSCPNRSDCHATFGAVDVDGERIGLYPFTTENIVRLYRQASGKAADASTHAVRFNPRRLVSRVLNEVLKEAEQSIPSKGFPTPQLIDSFRLRKVSVQTQQRIRERHGNDASRVLRAMEMYAPHSDYVQAGIAETFDMPVVEITTKQGQVRIDAPTKPAPIADSQSTDVAALEDEYDRWVNGEELGDKLLNLWRNRVHQAVVASIDWDTEEYFSEIKERFGRRNIYFEGQQTREASGDVRLRIARDPQTALVLRFLEKGFGSATMQERDDLVLYTAETLAQWSKQVYVQVQDICLSADVMPTARQIAAQCLVLGSMLRGTVNASTTPAVALQHAFQCWPKPHEKMAEHWPESWRKFVEEYQRLAPRVQAWLRKTLACTKGGVSDAGILDPSSVFQAVKRVLESGRIDSIPERLTFTVADDSVEILAREALRRHDQVLKDARTDCQQYLDFIDQHLGDDEPGILIRTVGKSLAIAAQHGVLRGANSLELLATSKHLGLSDVSKAVTLMRHAVEQDHGRLDAFSDLPTKTISDFADYLKQADNALDESLKVAESTDDAEVRPSTKTLQKSLRVLLKSFIDDLKSLGSKE